MRKTLLAVLLCGLPSIGMAGETAANGDKPPQWRAHGALATPALSDAVPPATAGCVVVGHEILADGTVTRPRILTGAFAGAVDAAVQREFSLQAMQAATQWRFEYVGEASKPAPAFHMETVGFLPAGDASTRVVTGIQNQYQALGDNCEITDLAAWGNENAVSIERALAANGDRVLIRDPELPRSYWLVLGEMVPPKYPRIAAQFGVEGCVVLGFTIKADGRVEGMKIMAGEFNGNTRPEEREAMENSVALAVSQWRFAPGPDNLARLPEFRQMPTVFQLGSESGRAPPKCAPIDVAALTIAAGSAPGR